MNENSQSINVSQIGKWLFERGFIWQMKLLDEESFLRFAEERSINFGHSERDIKRLRKFWSLGLIRADLVITETPQETEGLTFLNKNDSHYIYADERKCLIRTEGYSNSLEELKDLSDDINLLFHPFRLFVFYKIKEIAKSVLCSFTLYSSTDNYQKYFEWDVKYFDKFTSREDFQNEIANWNDIVSLAVAAEPIAFRKLFGFYTIRYSLPFERTEKNEQLFYDSIQTHENEFKELLEKFNISQIKEIISEICVDVECIEPNSDILMLLRLMKGKYRLEQLKGNLGLVTYILTMAEVIRRVAEVVFEVILPEEDEFSFCGDEASYKEYFYGSPRLLDSVNAKTQFVRELGLDYNLRLRWYVEGQTEFFALQSYLGNNTAIEVINLKGEVVAGKGKGVAFRENLLNDISRSIYSWVSLDGDVSDNCRVVKKAVENGEMFGSFFFSNPDFEFENFSLDELVETVWEIAVENGAEGEDKANLIESTKSATNGAEFERLVRKSIPSLNRFSKGKDWGERLMRLSKSNPEKLIEDGKLQMRKILEAIRLAHYAIRCSYHLSKQGCKVNIETGRLVNCK